MLASVVAGCTLPEQEQIRMDVTRISWNLHVEGPDDAWLETSFLHCRTIGQYQDTDHGWIHAQGTPKHVNYHSLNRQSGPIDSWGTKPYHDQGTIRSPVDGFSYEGPSGESTRTITQEGNTFTIRESFTSKFFQDVRMDIDRRQLPCD